MVLSKDLKIAICFGLIMGVILSVCNLCFAVETEDVSLTVLNNVIAFAEDDEFVYSSGDSIRYFLAEPGYAYTINVNYNFQSARIVVTSSDAPAVGVSYNVIYDNLKDDGTSFSFSVSSPTYISISYGIPEGYITVEREELTGLSGFIKDLSLSLSINELSIVWNYAVPILAISVLFGLGFYLLKRLLNRIKRAKGGA